MQKLKSLFDRYKEVLLYLICGGATTGVNILLYYICYSNLGISNMVSNLIAFTGSVLFAFLTNKFFVFQSKSLEKNILLFEMCTFFGGRAVTGLLDAGMMYISVDLLACNAMLMKVLVNGFVIIANFAISKVWVFRKQN